MPEVASVPSVSKMTAWLYQPLIRDPIRRDRHGRRAVVVVEGGRGAGAGVAGVVGALTADRQAGAVRIVVGLVGIAAGDAGGGIGAIGVEDDGVVVPAVVISGPIRRDRHGRRAVVVVEGGRGAGAGVAGVVGALTADRQAGAVRIVVGLVGIAAGDAGGGIGAIGVEDGRWLYQPL